MCSIIGYCGTCTDKTAFMEGFAQTKSRGPDDCRVIEAGPGLLTFHRLAIMGLTPVNYLKEYAETQFTQEEFEEKCKQYNHARPFTKESLLYREIFEKYYPGQAEMIVDFWMPNKEWDGCDVNDPSARVLANYGNSGK